VIQNNITKSKQGERKKESFPAGMPQSHRLPQIE